MSTIEQYNWDDCCSYLKHMIIRVNDHYAIIGDDPSSSYVLRFETLDEAKRVVDSLYVTDLVFDLLLIAQSRGYITDEQREMLINLMDDELEPNSPNLHKILQKCTSFWECKVS